MRTLSCLPHSGGRWPSVARSDEGVVRFGVVPHPSRRSAVNSNGYAVTVLLSRKKAITRKILALLLSLSMVLLALPAEVGVVLATESAPSLSVTDRTLPQEEVIQRTATTKTFLMPDGTHTFVSYGTTVHKLTEDGTWDEVDNRLVLDEKTGQYVTVHGLSTVRFAKNTPSVSLETDTGRLSWSVRPEGTKAGDMAATVAVSDTTATAAYKALPAAEKAMTASKADGSLSYAVTKQAFSVDYTVSPESVKENIVITSATQNRFLITVAHEGLTPVDKGNYVVFTDQTGEDVFRVSAPLMFDAVGAESEGLLLDIVSQSDTSVTLLLAADKLWLSDSERVYPVTIDPIYTSSQVTQDIMDTYVHEGDAAGDHYNETKLYVGNRNGQKHYAYIKAPLEDLPAGITTFHSATFKLYLPDGTSTGGPFTLYAADGSWASGTISWNDRPSDYPGYSVANVPIATNADGTKTATFDVLAFVSTVYTSPNLNNLGFRIAYSNETLNDYNSFYSAEWGTQSQRPQFTVNYSTTGATVDAGDYLLNNYSTYNFLKAASNTVHPYSAKYDVSSSTNNNGLYWHIQPVNGYTDRVTIRSKYDTTYYLYANSSGVTFNNPGSSLSTNQAYHWKVEVVGTVSNPRYAFKNVTTSKYLGFLNDSPGTTLSASRTSLANDCCWSVWTSSQYSPRTSISVDDMVLDKGQFFSYSGINVDATGSTFVGDFNSYTLTTSNSNVVSLGATKFFTVDYGVATLTLSCKDTTAGCTFEIRVPGIEGVYYLKNGSGNKYMEGGYSSGSNIVQDSFEGSTVQQWIIALNNSGYYTIQNADTGFYLQVSGNSSSSEASVISAPYNSSATGQQFMIEKLDNGYCKIIPRCSESAGYVLQDSATLSDSSVVQGAYTLNSNYRDEWKLCPPLQYWNSDVCKVAYFKKSLTLFCQDIAPTPMVETDHEGDSFADCVDASIAEWEDALDINIQIVNSAAGADIVCYRVSESQYQSMTKQSWPVNANGKALGVTLNATDLPVSYQTTYGDTVIDVCQLSSPDIYILDTATPNALAGTSVTMHELGHALGYMGHSTKQFQLMYPQSLMEIELTEIEKNHLRQIYAIEW